MFLFFPSFSAWAIHCYGAEFWNKLEERRKEIQAEEKDEEDDDKEDAKPATIEITDENRDGNPPTTNDVMYLKHKACVSILEYQVSWAEAFGGITDAMGTWIYSLLTRIEKPLEPDVTSAIRTLAITISRQRASLIKEENDLSLVTALSVLICIGTKYFGQEDLADLPK